jgi:hypothetical protein
MGYDEWVVSHFGNKNWMFSFSGLYEAKNGFVP